MCVCGGVSRPSRSARRLHTINELVGHKTKGLRIATRCTTMDQFVAAFHRFCDAQTVFISTLNPRSVGLETAFSIDLADHTPALRGVGVVLQSWPTPQNPYGRPGLQLGIRRLTADSEPVFDRLLFAREATAATPTATAKLMPVFVAKPGVKRPLASTQQMPFGATEARFDAAARARAQDRCLAGSRARFALVDSERTPGSDLVLPANPLMNISDHSLEGFVDCTLYEETGNFFGEQPVVEDPEDPVAAPPLLAPRRTTTPPQPAMIVSRPPEEVAIPSIPSLATSARRAGVRHQAAADHQQADAADGRVVRDGGPVLGPAPRRIARCRCRRPSSRTTSRARMTPPPLDPPPPHRAARRRFPASHGCRPRPPSSSTSIPIRRRSRNRCRRAPHTEYPAYNAATHASGYDAVPAPPPYAPHRRARSRSRRIARRPTAPALGDRRDRRRDAV